jgi:hypothetical protein
MKLINSALLEQLTNKTNWNKKNLLDFSEYECFINNAANNLSIVQYVGLQKQSDQKLNRKINSIQCSPPRPF